MRVALYARVSTKEKDEKGNLRQDTEVQLVRLRAICKSRAWEWEEFAEQGISGTKSKRPELDRMMSRLGEFNGVIVLRIDRLGRSAKHLLQVIQTIRDRGLTFEAVDQGIYISPDRKEPVTNLLMVMLSGVAEFEHELISERVTDGIAHYRRNGKKWGRRSRLQERGIDPSEIMRRHGEGQSIREISQALGVGRATMHRTIKGGRA